MQIEASLQAAQQVVRDSQCLWAALVIRGFKHAPIQWEMEHNASGLRTSEEKEKINRKYQKLESSGLCHDYIVVLISDTEYLLYTLCDADSTFSMHGHSIE